MIFETNIYKALSPMIEPKFKLFFADKGYNNDRTNQNNVRMNISDRLLQKYREHYGKKPR